MEDKLISSVDWTILLGVVLSGCAIALVLIDDSQRVIALLLAIDLIGAAAQWLSSSVLYAGAYLVAGLGTCAILYIPVRGSEWIGSDVEPRIPASRYFRLSGVLLMIIFSIGIQVSNNQLISQVPQPIQYPAILMISVGLLQVALFTTPLRVGVGIFLLLSGFQISYSQIEPSLAVVALLVAVNMGIAIVSGFLIDRSRLKLDPEP